VVCGTSLSLHGRIRIPHHSSGNETTLESRIDQIRQTLNETRLDRSNGMFDGTGNGNLHHTSSTTAAYRAQGFRYSTPSLGICQGKTAGVRSVTHLHLPPEARLPCSLSDNSTPMQLVRTPLLLSWVGLQEFLLGHFHALLTPLPTLDLPFSFPGRASTHNEHSQVRLACFMSPEQTTTVYRSTPWYCATAIFTQCHGHSRTCHQRLYHIQCSHAGADIHTPVIGTVQTARLCYNGCAVMSGRPLINSCQSPSFTIPTSGYSPRLRRCN
jgi:hypothetical protein